MTLPAFAHASEAELARILDFYAVRWEYEPHTFPILWNLDGDVVESFAPDFYLPEFDLYVEMTTLKQRLVRKKNRKLRRLRELYPHIRIKLFYARDFRMLMLKYGKLGIVESLSGTPGQVVPSRAAVAEAVEPALGAAEARLVAGSDGAAEAAEAPVAAAGEAAAAGSEPTVAIGGMPGVATPTARSRRNARRRLRRESADKPVGGA